MTERHVEHARRGATHARSCCLALTILSPVLLGGCALPPAIELASWAITGFSYAATGKGVGEHAISLAVQEDCAILNMAEGEEFCVPHQGDPATTDSMIASADTVDSDLEPAAGPREWRQTASTITDRYGAAQAAAMPVDL